MTAAVCLVVAMIHSPWQTHFACHRLPSYIANIAFRYRRLLDDLGKGMRYDCDKGSANRIDLHQSHNPPKAPPKKEVRHVQTHFGTDGRFRTLWKPPSGQSASPVKQQHHLYAKPEYPWPSMAKVR
jgi:hypothetical protein